MNAVIVRTSISRNTGQQISKEIIGFEEVDEDDYYHPLVEVFGKRFVNDYQMVSTINYTRKEVDVNAPLLRKHL